MERRRRKNTGWCESPHSLQGGWARLGIEKRRCCTAKWVLCRYRSNITTWSQMERSRQWSIESMKTKACQSECYLKWLTADWIHSCRQLHDHAEPKYKRYSTGLTVVGARVATRLPLPTSMDWSLGVCVTSVNTRAEFAHVIRTRNSHKKQHFALNWVPNLK